jgi:uncharacterized paraquat-inducible protein A
VAGVPVTNDGATMDLNLLLLALLGACVVGILALLVRIARERGERDDATRESPIAMSSEGVKLCPGCATENLWTDTRCVRCGRKLPDAQRQVW